MAKKRKLSGVQEINAGSMADIAFLLLIFFLVATTMDADKGISRQLPRWEEVPPDKNIIKEKNIFEVVINSNDELLVENEYTTIEDLRFLAKEFIDNNGDGSCEYCQGSRNPESSDSPSKGILSIANDRGTSYEMYILVQNELAGAVHDLRDELAERQFGKPFDDLGEEARNFVRDIYPQIISEAEPVNLGN